jgi:hypothetical protein
MRARLRRFIRRPGGVSARPGGARDGRGRHRTTATQNKGTESLGQVYPALSKTLFAGGQILRRGCLDERPPAHRR